MVCAFRHGARPRMPVMLETSSALAKREVRTAVPPANESGASAGRKARINRWLPPAVADSCSLEIRALAVRGGIDESNACVDFLHRIEFVKTNFWSNPPPIEDESIAIDDGAVR